MVYLNEQISSSGENFIYYYYNKWYHILWSRLNRIFSIAQCEDVKQETRREHHPIACCNTRHHWDFIFIARLNRRYRTNEWSFVSPA